MQQLERDCSETKGKMVVKLKLATNASYLAHQPAEASKFLASGAAAAAVRPGLDQRAELALEASAAGGRRGLAPGAREAAATYSRTAS